MVYACLNYLKIWFLIRWFVLSHIIVLIWQNLKGALKYRIRYLICHIKQNIEQSQPIIIAENRIGQKTKIPYDTFFCNKNPYD